MQNNSVQTFLKNSGWSSHKFKNHFQSFFELLQKLNLDYQIGRTVIKIHRNKKMIAKVYVHHKGDSNEWVTIQKGDEILKLHFEQQDIIPQIKTFLQ